MREITHKIYKFDELDDDAQKKALENYRSNGYLDYEWWDGVYDMAHEVYSALGVAEDNIYFSGFWSQGDGASFDGTYSYSPGWRKMLADTYNDECLVSIGEKLQAAQRPSFYALAASISVSGHYCHEMSMRVAVEDTDDYYRLTLEQDDEVTEALRSLAQWTYYALEREHEWLMSDEVVRESIECNGVEFYENGEFV